MANWRDSAKNILDSTGYVAPTPPMSNPSKSVTTSKTPTTGTKATGSWRDSAKNILDSTGYVAPEKRLYELKLKDGTSFGVVSYDAFIAATSNNLDHYLPKNKEEKKVIDDFKKYDEEQKKKYEESIPPSLKKGATIGGEAYFNTADSVKPQKDGFWSWLGKNTMAGVGQFNKGFAATADFLIPTDFLGKYDPISNLNDYYSDLSDQQSTEAQKSSASRGKGWDIAGQIVSGTVAALPNAVLAYMSAGTSLGASGATTIAGANTATLGTTASATKQVVSNMMRNPSYWSSALQTLGTDYEEAKERGANDFVAATSAILTTALNAGIEVGSGIEQLPKNLKQGGKNAVYEWVKSSFEEGGEEVLQKITTNAVAKMMYDHDAPIFSTKDENAVINPISLAKDFGMGVAVGGLLGGGQSTVAKGINSVQYIKAGKYFKNAGDDAVQFVVNTGLATPKDSKSYKLAEKAQQKLNKNKTLSNYEVGKIHLANVSQMKTEMIAAKETTATGESSVTETPVVAESATSTPEPVVTEQQNTFTEELDEIASTEMPSVSVGDVFIDTKTNNIIKVVERNESSTLVEITPPSGQKETKTIPNHGADTLNVDDRYNKFETSTATPADNVAIAEDATTTSAEAVAPKNEMPSVKVGDVYRRNDNGVTYTITARDENKTSVLNSLTGRIDVMSNATADVLFNNPKTNTSFSVTKVQDGQSVTSTEAENMHDKGEPAKKEKKKIVRAKKSDWASHDIYWYAPNTKTIIAYSTRSASDLISAMSEDSPKMTISELHDAINYDEEAKKVLQAYINNGFGDYSASEYFTDNSESADTEISETDAQPTENEIVEESIEEKREKIREKAAKTGVINLDELGTLTGIPVTHMSDTTENETTVSPKESVEEVEENKPDADGAYAVMDELGLTEEQQSAIMKYKSGESYTLNFLLRDGKALEKHQQRIKDSLNEALQKFPVYNGVVYRNIGFIEKDAFDAFVAEHKEKTSITYPAFTSASKSLDGYVIEAPYLVHYEIEGFNGRDVSQIGITAEKEVLYGTDTTFEFSIIKQTENELFLKMKEVTGDGKSKLETVLEERGKQHSVQESSSESNDRRSDEEVHSTPDAVRGRSTTDDELYKNTSESNSRRIDDSGGTNNTSGIGKTGDASDGERKLSGIETDNNRTTQNDIELTDKCELIATKHTATGNDIWVVTIKDRIPKDEYKELNAKVKSVGGYYSRYAKTPDGKTVPGFVFKSEPSTDAIKVFNDFFGDNEAEEKTPVTDVQNTEEVLKNQSESDTEKSEETHTSKVKEDFKVGDVLEFDGEQWECVRIDTMMIDFVNVDKNAFNDNMSVILPYELFKEKTDYRVIKNQSEETPKSVTPKTIEKETDKTVSKSEGTKHIADYVANKLSKGEKISAPELQKIATEAFGGTMSDNAFSIKDAYDAMELGVNQHILSMKDVSAEKMLELLELLPTQTKRTEEMVKFQQFSTPPSIAYLANYTANINSNDIMLEPSAGIGGIAVFAKKDGAKVYVNELDSRRLEVLKNMPFDGFYNENAEQLDNILGGEIEPTVIVMNPPFSSSAERNMKKTKIGASHIEQALKILAPNGRLVAIVGNGMADGEPAFRNWWKDIKSQYNVRANIGINGKNYNKYGTNFDIQMLVIDKNGATTTDTVTGYVDTLQELQEKLGGIRDERPAIDYSSNEQRTPATTREETTTERKTTDNENGIISESGSGTAKGKSADAKRPKGKSDIQDIQPTDAEHRKSTSVKPENTDVVADENRRVGSGQSDGLDGKENSVGVDNGDSGQSDIQTRRTEPRKRVKRKELTDSIFEQYQTQPLKVKNAQPHPAKVSESAAMSAIEPPAITYTPNISQDIIDKGVISDVQLEAISYAGQSHSQTLPNGTTRGFFLGDGTGIGKGRTIAGMMLDNYNQGRKKAVWVTLNSSLVNDAKRDVKALFGSSDLVTQFVGGNKADSVLNTDEAIMVISYSALSKGFDNKDSNFEKMVKWLGDDFDGLIVFDEAHKMGNATSTKGTRGVKKASQTGLAGIALQEALPKAKIVYSSATGATEVENLRYAERLGLWGEGTPFIKGDDFVSKVKAGGLAAMELIARDMKALGVYLSRNISYDDVQYDKITHKLTSQQTKIYDELARSWQIVLNNINKALETTNQDKDGHARGRALGAFWSSQQRFFNQILTSMQVPSVISDIEKQLADGKSCVIQLVSTNEAAQNQEFERLKSEDLELDEFDLTPKQVLMSLIENSFPVQQFEEYRDDNGNVRSRPVFDSKGNPVINREAVRQRDELLSKLGSIKVPSSPIDMIINHFGTDLVAENTGRARRVIQKDGKTIEEKIGSKKDADVDAFQNGKKRIIIFSKAGGTGKSYHADKAAKNQQQRVHYLLEAGWQADNAVQGFGRSHRSNQASAPIFKLVTTDLKGQMRFISTIAKRLDQLGAMTKGQRQAGSQGMFSASDNLENSFAADVLAGFYKDLVLNRVDGIDDGLTILEKLGLKSKILDEYNRIIPTAPELREVNKFLNRILSLESSEQNTVFEGYSQRLQDATEKAMLAGTLDKGLENYKADKITLNDVQDIREDENSGAKTKYYNLTAEHKIKPIKFTDVPTALKSFVGFYQNKNTGALRAVFQTSSSTDQYGNVTQNYKLMGQVKNEYIPQHRLYGNWEELKIEKAENLWNEEVSKLPEFRQENLHLISGVVLPVWDKLPTENVRIYRVLTSDGEMLIGRVISEDMIDGTLRNLGFSRKKERIATKDLISGIKNGDKVHLENGWQIVQSRVSNEKRIEIKGPSYEHYDLITGKGVFAERISYNTRYFVPADTNTEKILDDIFKISPVMRVETEKYSIESEELSDEARNNLLSGNSNRGNNASAGKQAKRISDFKQKLKGKTRAARKSFTKELLAKGQTEEIITDDGKYQFNIVKPEAYNEDMLSIVEEAKTMGKDVGFFVGQGKRRFSDIKIDAIKQGDKILLRYDGVFAPQNLFEHEKVHNEWLNPEMQKAKDIILNDLSEAEKKKILAQDRYKQYMTLHKGDEDAVLQEFVCDVFGGMNEYAADYIDLVVDYWYNGKVINRYNPAEYINSIDAGGNESILNNIGFGEKLSIISDDYTERALPEGSMINEYHKDLNSYEWWKYYQHVNNYDWDAELIKNTFNFYTIIGDKLIKSKYSKGKPSVLKIYAVNSVELLPYEEGIIYDNDTKEILDELTKAKESLYKGTDDNFRMSIEEQGKDNGRAVNTDGKQLDSTSNYELPEQANGTITDDIKYSLSVDDDITELTPERKKEIFEQFEKDRAGVDKPTQKQLWGERAEWIAHNMTRVFPDIPERGERGTFFAEFRKMMIQWKALPQTSMFMTQDKLNQMTKDLTPDEFKTFSELVYFLDLQEEAQMQKERGYEEILLPNEITPHEVDQIIDVLNEEATENVHKALEKRRQIWDNLKEQYVTLNQYVGFDTSEKFKRKNYYHHQVIEYMNQGGKGVAKGKDIEIKAGRGWLKQRQGSTEAINTDFLAVEYKAMLQMQYDIYVANMLGKIKDKYDIKPQLEKQAFDNNKKLLNDIIKEEATDEKGNVLIDSKGKPDSETYRQQQWYNQRIMFGFSGLFDLAEANILPTFNGQYGNIIRALQRHNLNAPGLYNYVSELASMELPETATDEELQARISARTVLKYTSQKKAWVKEILADDYQTWETLASDMKDTHSIHQPRRGNYFYTKTTVDEDAFNKAFSDMIVGLVAGENGVDTTSDMKKLFEQYSETIRLMGAAYEQWVIPNEIETTMNKVANPKQVGVVSQLSRTILSTWKGWATSVNPLRTLKFGVRNLFGDLDAVIAGNPKVVLYSKHAVEEIYQAMKHKKYSPKFMEWVERGGYSSLIFANEMDTEMQDKLFSHLKNKEGLNIFKIPVKLYEGYYNGVETAHNFREAILRYSAYLYFKNDIVKNDGKVKDNVASNRYIIQGLQSVEDKAYQLSKDLLGAYDEVATMGQALRRHAIPFYSFTETNLKRYFRLFENIIMSDDSIPKKAGKLLLKSLMVNTLTLLMIAWNRLVMKDEDDELPPSTRNVPHITLGKIGDDVYAFRQLGSFSELLEWIGFEDYEWTKEDATAPLDKLAGMITPVVKTPVELITGLNFYPSVTQPRAIRDKTEHFFSTLGVDSIYRVVVGKPTKGIGDIAKGTITYSYDYKESAYYEILDIKREYQGDEDGSIYKPTAKSNALYYMKQAIRYKDKEAALKYLDEYFENGGTGKGITQSIQMLDPMYGYLGEDTYEKGQEFVASLTDEEKEKLKIAQDFYENDLKLPDNVSAMLRKKGITDEEAKNLLTNFIKSKCK